MKHKLTLFVCLLSICCAADPLDELEPGEWYEFPNSKLSVAGVFPEPLPPGNTGISSVMSAWSGAVYDSKRDRLLVWGGGHADYSGNEIYAFDIKNGAWTRIWGPTPNNLIPLTGTHVSYPDGNPSSRHTYNSILYLGGDYDFMLNMGGSRWKETQGSQQGYNWTRWFFHLDSLSWEGRGNSSVNCDSGIAYDTASGSVFCRDKYNIWEYDLETDSLKQRYRISAGWGAKTTAAIDPVSRKMLFLDDCKLAVFNLETGEFSSYGTEDLEGDTEILCARAPGLELVAEKAVLVAWSGERSHKELSSEVVYVIDPVSLRIEKRYPKEGNGVIPTESASWGTYGRFRYVPSRDIFIVVNGIHENVYAYKLSSETSPPPGWGASRILSEPEIETNVHSIGIQWAVDGDINHNAECDVSYRIIGAGVWKQAMPLFRIDHLHLNMMAGSIMFLEPGTAYEVRLVFRDPDGGEETRLLQASTRPYPKKAAKRTFHVVPGDGGGDGSFANPFRGVSAAQDNAEPGDLFLLHAGDYGTKVIFDRPGSRGQHIVWASAGDGPVRIKGIEVRKDYIWIDGLDISSGTGVCPAVKAYGDRKTNSPHHVVISNNTITGGDGCSCNQYLVYVHPYCENWTIIDNTLKGDVMPSSGTLCGEGIELWHSSGHTVAYNSISHVADGISYPGRNVDIFGNDIFDVSDDGIEPDFGYPNTRIWGNRITNAYHNAISLQDFDKGVPWYIIRNQITNYEQSVLKTRMNGRFVFLHNTVVNWDDIFQYQPEYIKNGFVKNNLIISYNGGYVWNFGYQQKSWRTDIDYNGFDWGGFAWPFYYDGKRYADLGGFSAVSKLDANSITLKKEDCLPQLSLAGPVPAATARQHLNIAPGCKAVDKGTLIANINDDYAGSAPDLGAYELGAPLPQYGPRGGSIMLCSSADTDRNDRVDTYEVIGAISRWHKGEIPISMLLTAISEWKNGCETF